MSEEKLSPYEEVIERAKSIVEKRQSRSWVEDAEVFARFILDTHVQTMTNLTAAQERCTSLMNEKRDLREENRLLRQKLGEHPTPYNAEPPKPGSR